MNKRGMSRREFLRLSAVGVTGLLAASCGAQPTQEPESEPEPEDTAVPPTEEVATVAPPAEKVKVDWWHTWSGPAVVEAAEPGRSWLLLIAGGMALLLLLAGVVVALVVLR